LVRAEPELQQEDRHQQRNVMAGGAIHLHEVALPEILDPRQVKRQPSGLRFWNVL
jgi:hypothetical protein